MPDANPRLHTARRFYTTVWDYIGGDCGDLPGEFATEQEAIDQGDNWVAEMKALLITEGSETEQTFEDGLDGTPVYHVVRHEVDQAGVHWVYDDEDKLLYTSPELDTIIVLASDIKVDDRISISGWLVTEVAQKEDTVFVVVTGGRYGTKVISYPADTEVVVRRRRTTTDA